MVEWTVVDKGYYYRVRIHGSNDLRDWLFNFMTGRTIGSNVRVNRWDRYEALVVLRALREYRDKPIHVWGHSRGGAIAQIVAYELKAADRLMCLQVFGSKRTGNRAFVQRLIAFNVDSIRLRGDWIPFLPPWYWPLPTLVHGPWRPVWIAHNRYSLPRM